MGARAREEAGDRREADDLRDRVTAHERAHELARRPVRSTARLIGADNNG